MGTNAILAPVVALILWSCVMWLWMYATRIPAIQKSNIDFTPGTYRKEDLNQLPPGVQWKAENYNHLMEQPTIFYAVALSLALLGAGDGINLWLAWAYVAARVVHSVFQSTVNVVPVRFLLFVVSNVPLFWLAINAALLVFR